jgi:subtilisin family serine protease
MDPNRKQPHIILTANSFSTGDFFSGRSESIEIGRASVLGGRAGTSVKVAVEVEELNRNSIGSVANRKDVLAIAPVIPMKLIEPIGHPLAVEAPAAPPLAWGISAVGANTSPYTGSNVVVAVLDTGIDRNHPRFAGIKIKEKDFTGEGNGDHHGHGTHCAGTIFGRDLNGSRIGVAPGISKVLIGKVLGGSGGSSADLVNAMYWALQNGANVISMSLGIDFTALRETLLAQGLPPVAATSRALESFRATVHFFEKMAGVIQSGNPFFQPCIVVAAAGNESNRPQYEIAVSPPAVSEGFISVAAVGESPAGYSTAPFSNTGANVSGPGVDILSAAPGGEYAQMSGTSMATPHVAGVAALWYEKQRSAGELMPGMLSTRLMGSAHGRDFAPGQDSFDVGLGMVRAPQA